MMILELMERRRLRRSGRAEVREGTAADSAVLVRYLGRKMSDLEARWARNDRCCVAEVEGIPVSATWISSGAYLIQEIEWVFDPGERGAFLYDAYTAPEWRLKGLHVDVWEYILNRLCDEGIERVYCGVGHGNDLSLRSHLRFGFRVEQCVSYARVLGLRWHVVKILSTGRRKVLLRSPGFRVGRRGHAACADAAEPSGVGGAAGIEGIR
jgi:GNAT superfamily N-acetyltransferase